MKWAVFESNGLVTVISYNPPYRGLQFSKMKSIWKHDLKYPASEYVNNDYLLDIECKESDLLTHIPSELWL